MDATRALSRTLVRNILIILIGTHLLAFFFCFVYGNVRYIVQSGDGEAVFSWRRYSAPYDLFFDGSGGIYTVLIGVMAAGITLFSQTGMPMSNNSIVSSLQFKYFDIMSFVFNCFAALFGALLMQAVLATWGTTCQADTFGTSFVGASVLWLVCSLMAPANSAVRAARLGDRSQLVDQLERYRQASLMARRRLESAMSVSRVWWYPAIGIAVVATGVSLSRTGLFGVAGGTASLSWVWIFIFTLLCLVSVLLGWLFLQLFTDIRVSWLAEGFQSKVLSVAVFSYICFAILFSVLLIGVSVLDSAGTLGGGLAIWVYFSIFGVFPAACSFAFGGWEDRYWRSIYSKLNKRTRSAERDLKVFDNLAGGYHRGRVGYL